MSQINFYAECRYAECHYAECGYAECHYAECFGAPDQTYLALTNSGLT
jgi:hypothetical protein